MSEVELDSVEEVEAFYEADPEFFRIKTTADIPTDLKWEDGSSEKVFASPKAKRGGTLNTFTGDWPRTLRFVGPDASGSFRQYILDSNALILVESHPQSDGYYPSIAKRWAVGTDKRTILNEVDTAAPNTDGKQIQVNDFFYQYYLKSPHIGK